MIMRLLSQPKICTAQERHVRRPGWTDLFFDLVFAAAIAQLSAPLGHDYSFYGIARFTFLLALVFLAWFGYTAFSTQFAVDDVVERGLIVAQVFLVAVMAANATDALSSRDAAGFGAAYGGVRAILALQYARVIRLPDAGPLARRRIAGLFVSRGFVGAVPLASCAATLCRMGRCFVDRYRQFLAGIAEHNRIAARSNTFPGTIRTAYNHFVRRICRLSNAGNRNSNGLEFSGCFRCGA